MYYGKKKKIIIAVIIIVLILVLAGVGLFLFLKTDLFKSNDSLFFQYLGKEMEQMQGTQSEQLRNIEKMKMQNPYTTTGEITASYSPANGESQEQIDAVLGNLKITVDGKYNTSEEQANTTLNLRYGTQTIFTVDAAQTGDLYGIKAEEIVQNAYVGVRNENLNALIQKLMPEGQTISGIDKITQNANWNDIMKLSEEEKTHISDTYLKVLQQAISKNHYTKQNDMTVAKGSNSYKTTAYRLDLTGDEVVQVVTKLFETLKQDSITLNLIATKAKLLELDSTFTEVNSLTKLIDQKIKTLQTDLSYFKDGMSIVLYVHEGEVLTTEIIIKNQIKLSFDIVKTSTTTQSISMVLENLSTETSFSKITAKIVETQAVEATNLQIECTIDDKTLLSILYESKGTSASESITNTWDISFTEDDEMIGLMYQEELKFVDEIEDMDKLGENVSCGVLNDYDQETLQNFLGALIIRIGEVFEEKTNMIMTSINNTIQTQQPEDGLTGGDGQNTNTQTNEIGQIPLQ